MFGFTRFLFDLPSCSLIRIIPKVAHEIKQMISILVTWTRQTSISFVMFISTQSLYVLLFVCFFFAKIAYSQHA